MPTAWYGWLVAWAVIEIVLLLALLAFICACAWGPGILARMRASSPRVTLVNPWTLEQDRTRERVRQQTERPVC